MPTAFITGITGQDGRHLAEFLHGQGYDVYGMVKGQNNPRAEQVIGELPFVELVNGDLADLPSLVAALEFAQPDEVYNLGAISFVALSFSQPELTANTTGLGVLRMLEAIRMVGGTQGNPIRFYQASSSEMFGKVRETPQNELTPFHPRSPYGAAKVFGHDITVNYRESYGLYACSGILFNHEGPKRGLEFVTRKVTNAVARIKLGLQHELVMGPLDTKRDWGYAGDYVRAMWSMLQQDEPDDYVIATGETHTVEEFVARAFAEVGIEDWSRYVRQDPKFYRPAEVDLLIGDATKARTRLGWQPEVDFSTAGQDDDRQRPPARSHQSRHHARGVTHDDGTSSVVTSGPMSDDYFSQFGGLWTDRRDAVDELDLRVRTGRLRSESAPLLRDWMANGFVVLPNAVDARRCEALKAEIDRACRDGDDEILMQDSITRAVTPVPKDASTDMVRIVDMYAVSATARSVLFASEIVDYLRLVFDDDPLLFQSLSFEKGSQQGIHQDTAYVVVDRPMELVAAWIALEDVQPGSGELAYIPGSHRLPEYCFSGEFKHWSPDRDGDEQHHAWSRHLHDRSRELGLEHQTFLPKRGDVFIWSADLAHGGSSITRPGSTRRSIVGHYCPAAATPHFFSYQPGRSKHRVPNGYITSHYYGEERLEAASQEDMRPAPAPLTRRLITRARRLVART